MAVHTDIMKQYKDLVLNIKSFSAGQAYIGSAPPGDTDNEDTLTILYIDITPNDGPYKGGTFKFKLDLSDDYPNGPPKINCLTNVYHPNIDQVDEYSEGDICLNLLDELWTPDLSLDDYVQGLLFMFYNPNVEDPLNPAFYGSESPEELEENIRKSMRGEEVDGVVYDKVLPDDEESEGLPLSTESAKITVSDDKETASAEKEVTTIEKDPVSADKEIESNDISDVSRDEATGQHIATNFKDVTPFILPRLLFAPASTRLLVKDIMQYSFAYLVVRASVYIGIYLINKPIAR